MTPADNAKNGNWAAVRGRFIRYVCFTVLLFVATGLSLGIATGDAWRTILASAFGLLCLGISLCVAYLRLRRKYAQE